MKKLTSIFINVLFIAGLHAQDLLPYDSAVGKIVYRYRISTDKRCSKETAYALVQEWFEKNPCEFRRCNLNQFGCVAQNPNLRNMEEVEKVFGNPTPLQALDPESNRITGKVVTKYTGDALGLLKVIYLESFMVITIKENAIECEMSDIRYNHFNPKSFLLQRINNWSDFTSLEPVNTVEYLQANQKCIQEYGKFANFLNEDYRKLFSGLDIHIRSSKSLSMNGR